MYSDKLLPEAASRTYLLIVVAPLVAPRILYRKHPERRWKNDFFP